MTHLIKEQPAAMRLSAQPRSDTRACNPLPYRLEQVTRQYGERLALDIPELEVQHGEVLALVGPSGAGKSTLLRLLNFLEPPSAGTIWFQGMPVRRDHPLALDLRRQVTMVFQRPILFSTSVVNNVAYGLQIRQTPQARSQAHAALEQVGLAHLADKPTHTLSGGEMQRVALARAIVLAPRVLLLDEPTANLDPYNVQVIERIIAELHQQHTTTIILVTHNVFQARRLAQRVALLLAGQIIEIADTTAFFEAPKDARTAAFVRGEMIY
jgi:tungstate transport system ATP-binding protein